MFYIKLGLTLNVILYIVVIRNIVRNKFLVWKEDTRSSSLSGQEMSYLLLL